MKTFKQFITEGVNDNFLYHGTTVSNAIDIIKTGRLLTSMSKQHGNHGKRVVCFSRDIRYAAFLTTVIYNNRGDIGVVFVFNKQAIAKKTKPFDWYYHETGESSRTSKAEMYDNESEEYCDFDVPVNSRTINKIIIVDTQLEVSRTEYNLDSMRYEREAETFAKNYCKNLAPVYRSNFRWNGIKTLQLTRIQ